MNRAHGPCESDVSTGRLPGACAAHRARPRSSIGRCGITLHVTAADIYSWTRYQQETAQDGEAATC